MRYCKSCILPDTRPNLVISEDGICNACNSFKIKPKTNSRINEFKKIVDFAKSKNRKWDCIIPVSGGKDSTWQVLKALEYNLKPLCITWKTPARTSLGQSNLNNLIDIGVDHIDFSINSKVEKAFTLETLKQKGSVAIPMHFAIHSLPLQFAIKFNIPLVIYGENSAVEYGGEKCLGSDISREWLLTYGVTQGTLADDWITETISQNDLNMYRWPSDSDLKKNGIKAVFLGHYFNWDPTETFKIAKDVGFKSLESDTLVGIYEFADVDDAFLIPIHHWLKWYKFGFTRTWDNLSLEIRNKRITRKSAINKINSIGYEEPMEAIKKFCKWSGISREEFDNILEKFRNKKIWALENNIWKIQNFLIKDWEWK